MRSSLLILLYLTLAAAWTWRLRSAPAAIVEDPQRGPRLERLARYLAKAPPTTVQGILYSIAPLPDDRIALMDVWLKRPSSQQLRELTVQETPLLKNAGTLRQALLLGWLGQDPQPFLPEAAFMITAAGDRLDDPLRLYALECLARQALKENQPEAALPILDRAIALPNATWFTFKIYLSTAQTLSQPKSALRAINEWLRRQAIAQTDPRIEEAREMQIMLMLGLDRAEDALLAQIDVLKAAPAKGPLPEITLDRALVCGRAASQEAKLLPWLERQLATYPEHALSPPQLLEKTALDSSYRHWLMEYAAIADQALPAASAFEACLRLAAMGERSAFARFCALAEAAKRGSEADQLLHLCLSRPELRLAVLEVAARDSRAQRCVTEALRKAPNDRELHFAATLASAAHQPTTATTFWQAYLRRFPNDAAAHRRLIQAHLNAHQPDLALRVSESIPAESLTTADKHQRELLRQM